VVAVTYAVMTASSGAKFKRRKIAADTDVDNFLRKHSLSAAAKIDLRTLCYKLHKVNFYSVGDTVEAPFLIDGEVAVKGLFQGEITKINESEATCDVRFLDGDVSRAICTSKVSLLPLPLFLKSYSKYVDLLLKKEGKEALKEWHCERKKLALMVVDEDATTDLVESVVAFATGDTVLSPFTLDEDGSFTENESYHGEIVKVNRDDGSFNVQFLDGDVALRVPSSLISEVTMQIFLQEFVNYKISLARAEGKAAVEKWVQERKALNLVWSNELAPIQKVFAKGEGVKAPYSEEDEEAVVLYHAEVTSVSVDEDGNDLLEVEFHNGCIMEGLDPLDVDKCDAVDYKNSVRRYYARMYSIAGEKGAKAWSNDRKKRGLVGVK
jgi:hypothetical protein